MLADAGQAGHEEEPNGHGSSDSSIRRIGAICLSRVPFLAKIDDCLTKDITLDDTAQSK